MEDIVRSWGCQSMTNSSLQHHRLVATLIFTTVLLGLISVALDRSSEGIVYTAIISVAVLATVFHFALPGSGFFSAVFANSVGIYACIYVFFLNQNFDQASAMSQSLGFVLPLIGFLFGVLWRRQAILEATGLTERSEKNIERDVWHATVWILPLVIVGTASVILPLEDLGATDKSAALLTAMTIIALTAFLAASDISIFLLDIAILFGDFFTNASHLAKPAFAFFTCYSLLSIIFGCLYTALDRFSAVPNFLVGGIAQPISFGEGLYLSIVTLSTVGYGDLSAVSPVARMIVAGEIFLGVLLLLFGVQAILAPGRR